jgi:hypothetical protein
MFKKNKSILILLILILVSLFLYSNIAGILSTLDLPDVEVADPKLREPGVYILNNPYKDVDWDTFNQYKANFHTHTTESDGLHDPDYVIDAYHSAGYHILALSDHDNKGPDGEWPPKTEPTWPWTAWDRDPEELDPKMLAVKGNEISSPHHHLSLFNDFGSPATTIEDSLDEVERRGGVAILAHPGRYTTQYRGAPYSEPLMDAWYLMLYANYHNAPLVGLEVYNLGDSYPDDRDLWDRLNTITVPEITIFGYSGDDMHHKSDMFKNYQFMLMEELSEAALKEAMMTGAFYFCYEPDGDGSSQVPLIEKIEVTDDETVLTITASNIDINQSSDSIIWITDKGVVGSGFFIDLNEIDLEEDIFIRAVLINEYGRTYTQPFALLRIE